MLALNIRATSFVTETQNDSMFIRTSSFGGSLVGGCCILFSWFIRGKDICYVRHVVHIPHDIILNNVQKVMSYDIK